MTTPDEALENLPIVQFPGERFERWTDGYNWGVELNERFPDAEPYDFASAIAHNEHPFGDERPIIESLVCTKVGENDGESWVWVVDLDNGERWRCEGSCDYTGWDCQSGVEWEKLS